MNKKIVLTYEGEVKDGFTGIYVGEDSVETIKEKIESFLDTGKKIKIKIEYEV